MQQHVRIFVPFFYHLSFALLVFFSAPIASASESSTSDQVRLDFPLLDLPFNSDEPAPNLLSMRQTLEFSTSFYQGFHRLIGGEPGTERQSGRIWWILGFDLLTNYIPLGSSWMHEEWHRAVMSNRHIGSFNDVNTLPFGKTLIAVSHVDDADLIRLKREHPADQVRMGSAGMEAQIQQNLRIEKDHFFNHGRTEDRLVMLMNTIGVSSYLAACSSKDADTSTDQQNSGDGSDVSKRDFTGLDCTAWAYDLFRPDEPYTQRGTHPSGVGVDRYIRYSDLNDREKKFLSEQMQLSLLNFVDPFLYNFQEFHTHLLGEDLRWNFRMSHTLTSFGGVVNAHLFVEKNSEKYLITLHDGMTDARIFPGLTVEWVESPLRWDHYKLTSGITIWQQPRGQRVEEAQSETVVDVMSQIFYELREGETLFAGLEAKTPGWIAGNVYLDRNLSAWAGFRITAF